MKLEKIKELAYDIDTIVVGDSGYLTVVGVYDNDEYDEGTPACFAVVKINYNEMSDADILTMEELANREDVKFFCLKEIK